MAPIANLTVRISAQIAELEKGLSTANQKLDSFGKQFTSVAGIAKIAGGALAAAFTVDSIIAFGSELVRMADDVQRVSDRTGLLTDEVQRLSFIAGQSGNSLDEVTGALGLMQKRMDDPSFLGALDKLGITFEQFRTQSPYQQLQQIATAFKSIKDPADQAQLATELFGRTGVAIIPTLRSEFEKLGAAAPVMSDETIKALDAAGDAWEKFKLQVKVAAAEGFLAFNKLANPFSSTEQTYAHKFFTALHLDTEKAKDDITGLGQWWDILVGKLEKAPNIKVGQAVKNAFSGAGVPKIRLSADEIAGIEADLNKEREALDKASKAADAHRLAIQALADKFSGAALARQVRDLAEAMALLKPGTDLRKLSEEIGRLFREGAKLTPEMIQIGIAFDTLLPKVVQGIGNLHDLGQAFDGVAIPAKHFSTLLPEVEQGIGNLLNDLPKLDLGYQFKIALPHVVDVDKALESLSQSLAQLSQISGGAFGDVVRDMSTLVSAANTAKKALSGLTDAKGNVALAFGSGAEFLNTASGLLALAAAAVQAGHALGGLLGLRHGKLGELLGTNASGRQEIIDFANTFEGGFEGMHAALLKLGDAGEAMWIKLTQGIGRADAKGALAAIQDAMDLLGTLPPTMAEQAEAAGFKTQDALQKTADQAVKLWEYMRDSGQYSAAAVQAAWERAQQTLIAAGDPIVASVQKAKDAVADLDAQISGLEQSIANEADEAEKGIVQQRVEAQIEGLKAQREEAVKTLEALTTEMTDSIHEVADAIRDLPKEIEILVRAGFTGEMPEPERSTEVSTGGYVGAGGILRYALGGVVPDAQHFGRGGIARFIPRGTDTIPAMLSPGEGIASVRGMSILGRSGLAALNAGRIPDLPTSGTEGGRSLSVVHNHYWQAVDEASVRNFIRRREFAEEFEREAVQNPNGIGSTIRQVAGA